MAIGRRHEAPDRACQALRDPGTLVTLSPSQWEPVIVQARGADVLGRIAAQLAQRGLLDSVPERPRRHLEAALKLVNAQHVEIRREAGLVVATLSALGVPVVLLKGAAYVVADAPAALGRYCGDIDILVPRAALDAVEGRLMLDGWIGAQHDDYDQRYYRQWMHELPPMHHVRRGTVLDVHHNILPGTVRRPPDAALLLAAAQPVPALPGAMVLDAPDQVLHSMTHLFHNEELSHGLRDLSDVDLLLRHHGVRAQFWERLAARARELNLRRPLYYGLWAAQHAFGTPMPRGVLAAAGDAPARLWQPLMHGLWRRGLRTPAAQADLPFSAAARMALYLRAHWLRMPPLLLARHLSRKAWKRARGERVAPA